MAELRRAGGELSKRQTIPRACKQLGIADQTCYRWCKEFGDLRLDPFREYYQTIKRITRQFATGAPTLRYKLA
ncbi:MAG: hypothetical protein HZB38_17035 [Planctomycetes bacterium]|nr:hypothetical protein [Planctomycetota bacterium]